MNILVATLYFFYFVVTSGLRKSCEKSVNSSVSFTPFAQMLTCYGAYFLLFVFYFFALIAEEGFFISKFFGNQLQTRCSFTPK